MTATEKVYFWQLQMNYWEATGLSGNEAVEKPKMSSPLHRLRSHFFR